MQPIDIYRACATLLNTPDKGSLEVLLALEVLAIAARRGALQAAMRDLGAPKALVGV